jgi:hypothetical protein
LVATLSGEFLLQPVYIRALWNVRSIYAFRGDYDIRLVQMYQGTTKHSL